MASGSFVPFRVSTLRGDQKIPFDVYIKIADKYIHYCRKGESFEGIRLERLKAKKLKKMYLRSEDDIPYRQYLEANIETAYNSNKPLEVRAQIIQGFQQAASEDYMDAPLDKMTYEHLRSSTQRFSELLENEPRGIGAILKLENTDKSLSHHGVAVATIAVAVTLEMKVKTGVPLHLLSLGCMIHDIEHVYTEFPIERPLVDLSPAEMKIYKSHTLMGAKRLQEAAFADPLVVNIILQHEELADGTGFPKKLVQYDMDPLVLVASVANAYDRLVAFENMQPKDALKHLLINRMGSYPLDHLQSLQNVLKTADLI